MSTHQTITEILKPETVAQVILGGDLSRLSSSEKLDYYTNVCRSLALNPLTQPFAYIRLNGKEVLYAKRDCTDQLRRVHQVSIKITARENITGVYVVTAQATMPDGRCDESTGAVPTENLKGDSLANAFLKAETKAKRRVTLSICGLGLLDESEIESIPENKNEAASSPAPIEVGTTQPGDHVIPFGKNWKGQLIKNCEPSMLESFIQWCERQSSPDKWSSDLKELRVKFNAHCESLGTMKKPPVFEELSDEDEARVEAMIEEGRMGKINPYTERDAMRDRRRI